MNKIIKALLCAVLFVSGLQGMEDVNALVANAAHGSIDQVRILLERGVDINATAASGSTALSYAVLRNQREICELLLDAGADPNIPDSDLQGGTPLIMATFGKGNPEMCIRLISAGANPNYRNKQGRTALYFATLFNKPHKQEICELIVEAMLNFRDAKQNKSIDQKKSIEALMVSLRRMNKTIPGVYGRDIRQLFREAFSAAIRFANARAEVDNLSEGLIRQHLLQKYFPSKQVEAMPIEGFAKEGNE